MSLIEDHVYPILPPEDMLIGEDDLVGCNTNLEMMLSCPSYSFFFPFFLVTVVCKDFHSGQELFEFHFPIENDRGGDDDEVLTPDTFIASEVSEEGDCLDRFSILSVDAHPRTAQHIPKTHFIRQDTIHVIGIQTRKPFKSSMLIRSQ